MLRKWALRLRSLLRTAEVDGELDDEVRYHVEMQTEEFVRSGMRRAEAVEMARRRFGNVTLHKEECRDTRHWVWLENLVRDFRHGVRTLRRSPGFTAVSMLTLAVGIGANSAMFSVIDQAILHPLTVPDSTGLVWLQEYSKDHSESSGNPARLADWQSARSFSAVAGLYYDGAVWASGHGPQRLSVVRTFGNLRAVLRGGLQMGRDFTNAELRGEGQPVVLLTGKAFREKFGANAAVLNQSIRLAGHLYQVVGVLGSELDFPEDFDLWIPARMETPSRAAGFLNIVGRLTPGVSMREAQAEIDLLASRLGKEYPATDAGRSARVFSLAAYVADTGRRSLLLLAGAVASVLFIGCLNISGLLLARGLARRREAAIRVSVGAGYGRLARLFFAESLLLSLAGCAAGLVLAFGLVGALKAALPDDVPHVAAMSVNGRVVWCGIGLSFVAALLFGGLPAWQFASNGQMTGLQKFGRSRLRSGLIVAEVTVSVVLVTTAALLGNSLLKVMNRPLGFDAVHAYTFSLDLPWDVNPRLIESLAAETIARMKQLPGTVACGVVDRLPLHGGAQSEPLVVRGKAIDPLIADKEFGFRTASSEFFGAVGIPLVAGRIYRDWQMGEGVRETVISERLAEILFPHEGAVGHEIAARPRVNGRVREPNWYRIVGVVGSVAARPDAPEQAAELYVPWGATYWPILSFVVRTERPLSEVARYVRKEIQPLTNDEIFSPVATLEEGLAEMRTSRRTAAFLVGGFAFVGLGLSALGIFGLMAHETKRRTQEIGVRLALGADPGSIALDAIGWAVRLATLGLAAGLAAAWYLSRLIESQLFEVRAHDAVSYVLAAALLLIVALGAAVLPALRAAKIDPIRALRYE